MDRELLNIDSMLSLKQDLIISHLFVSYTKLIWHQPVLRPSVEVFDLHNPNSILLIISIKPKMSWFKFKGQARIQTTATFALANLEKFVSEKSGKRCQKSGKYWIKLGNRKILKRFIFLLYPRLNKEFWWETFIM